MTCMSRMTCAMHFGRAARAAALAALATFVGCSAAFVLSAGVSAAKSVPVDLAPYFNNDGISGDEDTLDADLNGAFLGLPAEELPVAGSLVDFDGAKFVFPPKDEGQKNNCFAYGQTIAVPQGQYSKVYFLTASSSGSPTVKVTAAYADGSAAELGLKVADIAGAPGMKKYRVVATTHRHDSKGDGTPGLNLWGLNLALDSSHALISLGFDENPDVHIFAISLVPTGE